MIVMHSINREADTPTGGPMHSNQRSRQRARAACLSLGAVIVAASLFAPASHAQTITPVMACSAPGIGAVPLVADGAPVTILSAEATTTAAPASVPYCL